jgi:hypothetical protein
MIEPESSIDVVKAELIEAVPKRDEITGVASPEVVDGTNQEPQAVTKKVGGVRTSEQSMNAINASDIVPIGVAELPRLELDVESTRSDISIGSRTSQIVELELAETGQNLQPDGKIAKNQTGEKSPLTELSGIITETHNTASPLSQSSMLEFAAQADESESYVEQPDFVGEASEVDDGTLQIYSNFREALQTLISGHESIAEVESLNSIDAIETEGTEPLSNIVTVVVEKLDSIEIGERSDVNSELSGIVEMVQIIRSEAAESETAQAAQAKLKQAVVALFEKLDIEYEADDVDKFIAVILRPDFISLLLPAENYVIADLEKDGTHEAKKRLSSTAADFVNGAQYSLEKLLGVIMLIGSVPSQPAQSA